MFLKQRPVRIEGTDLENPEQILLSLDGIGECIIVNLFQDFIQIRIDGFLHPFKSVFLQDAPVISDTKSE